MSSALRYQPVTFDEFCFLVKDGEKADLIDGVIYMASPDNTDANDIGGWLYIVMRQFAEWKDLGRVFVSRVAFRLDETNAPEPDVSFVRKDRLNLVGRGQVSGPPDLAVEIVSPDSIDRDYQDKRMQYARFGVSEYWIVDELKEKVMLLQLGPKRRYREVRAKGGKLHSQVLPGFWIRPEWLWPQTMPASHKAIQEILASV